MVLVWDGEGAIGRWRAGRVELTEQCQAFRGLELIRFLQVAPTISVHHGAMAFLLGINALRASEAAAVRIEDYAATLRGPRVLRLVGKGNKPATMPLTIPLLRVLEACRGERTDGPLVLRPTTGKPIDRREAHRMVARIAKAAGIPRHISPHTLSMPRSPTRSTPVSRYATHRSSPATATPHHRALRPRPRQLERHGVHFLTAYVAGV